jgi:hypothetical protein
MEPPRSHEVVNSSSELQAFVEKLNMVAKSVIDNDRRLNRVEKTVGSMRGDKVGQDATSVFHLMLFFSHLQIWMLAMPCPN